MSYHFDGLDHVQLAAPEGCETEARHFFNKLKESSLAGKAVQLDSIHGRGRINPRCESELMTDFYHRKCILLV